MSPDTTAQMEARAKAAEAQVAEWEARWRELMAYAEENHFGVGLDDDNGWAGGSSDAYGDIMAKMKELR